MQLSSVHAGRYHFVFIPKRRSRVLVGAIAERMKVVFMVVRAFKGRPSKVLRYIDDQS